MKYALVNNVKLEAAKGLLGICPICQEQVIPKCGHYRINHWAHKSLENCDKWWESETKWHRNWKNMFPKELQEIVAYDEITGEKHIADIKTQSNLVVEFQHSNISEEERVSREVFYKKMVWVVDGTRRKNDFNKFCSLISYGLLNVPRTNVYVLKNRFYGIPNEWRKCKVPVIFDFKGTDDVLNIDYIIIDNDQRRKPLWCLLPTSEIDPSFVVISVFSRENFVDAVMKDAFTINYNSLIQHIRNVQLLPVSIHS